MHPVLAEILETQTVEAADGRRLALTSAMTAEEGGVLQRLVRDSHAQVTLEVGLANGVSALFICEALAANGGGRHIAIDPHQAGWHGAGLRSLERAGYRHMLEFHEAPSHRTLPALDAAGTRVDFALIDGWHTFDYALVDFFYIDRLLRVGGVVAFDDALSYPALRRLVRYVARNRHYRAVEAESPRPLSWRRRVLGAAASPLRRGWLRGTAARVLRAEVLDPDTAIGLPNAELVAFEKLADDVPGDGSGGTRRWDQHVDF